MSYWDTSTLVKLYAKEPDSATFDLKALTDSTGSVTCRVTLYEARATFRRKEIEGILQPGAAEKLYAQLVQDVSDGEMRLVELGYDLERGYENVLTRCYSHSPVILLRTLDALHLAAARVAGETELIATDRRMRDAAKVLGLSLFPT